RAVSAEFLAGAELPAEPLAAGAAALHTPGRQAQAPQAGEGGFVEQGHRWVPGGGGACPTRESAPWLTGARGRRKGRPYFSRCAFNRSSSALRFFAAKAWAMMKPSSTAHTAALASHRLRRDPS